MSRLQLSRRSFLTVSTAVGLTGLYGLYAHFVDPLVTRQELIAGPRDSRSGPVLPPRDSREAADRWLPPSQKWASQAAYQLRTDDAYIYFDDWEPTDSDEAVRLRPFCLIWMSEGTDSLEEPIRISCDSAYLRFVGQFKMPNANPGRVIGGALEGNVRIQGKDGLDIVGRNFVFSEEAQRVFSENHVEFRHGPHSGQAQGLQMELIPDETADSNDAVAVAGVKSVVLRRNVVMDLQLGEQLPAGDGAGGPPGKEKPPTPVRIRSDGSFTFVTETNLATFEDKVHVLKPVGPNDYDSLACDKLTLTFEPEDAAGKSDGKNEPADETGGEEESAGFGGISGKLTFRRLLAEGKQVVLTSKSNDMQSFMTRLEYDADDRVAALTDKKNVRVLQGTSELNAPEISLLHGDDGEAKSIWCRGAGWLTYYNRDTGQQQLKARWARQLRKYRDETGKPQLDIIELDQQAVVQQPGEQSGLAADFIKLWIEPQEKPQSTPGWTDPSSKKSQQVRIDRLLAQKNVVMVSPDMNADTEQLEVWFEDAELPAAPAVSVAPPAPVKPPRPAAPPLPVDARRPRPAKTVAAKPVSESPPAEPEAKTRQPVIVASDLIRARILHDRKQQRSQVAEVRTFGNVDLTQHSADGGPPLKIIGEELHVENKSDTERLVHVYGRKAPAHIRDPEMHLQGGRLHLDSAKNNAWVDGEGLLQIPVKQDLDGNPLPQAEVLDITWQDKMTFNGETARFLGGVLLSIQQSQMKCQEMDVTLTERISFADAERPDRERKKPDDPQADIKVIACKGNVEVASEEHVAEKLTQVRRGRFRDLTWDQTTGRQQATGPGWIAIWRKPQGDRPAQPGLASVLANKPLEYDASEWEYSRIDFAGTSDGNSKQRYTTFRDRVEIVHGPVDKLYDVIDPDAGLPDNGGWMRCDEMQMTHFVKTEARPAFLVVRGKGNAELEGRVPVRSGNEAKSEEFRGRADTINFDQSKGLYVLRSFGNRSATVWRGDDSRHDARSMQFIPALNYLKSSDTTNTIGIE